MNLLICTQTLDRNDSRLGFFHRWVQELAGEYAHVEVICLSQGEVSLPSNVTVYSLGKERGVPVLHKLVYSARFLSLVWRRRGQYDRVLVHMNQEYILLAGWLWKLMGKKVYMWRNHYEGSFVTDVAAAFCEKVFCTSVRSYTAKYKKTVLMPVGTDADFSLPISFEGRIPSSILSLGRIAPSKNIHLIVEVLGELHSRGITYTADIYGSTLPEDKSYRQSLIVRTKELSIDTIVTFHDAIPKNQTFAVYQSHEIFVNASPSGMLDKTIFSGMANGCIVLASSADVAGIVEERLTFVEGDAHSLADKLENILALSSPEKHNLVQNLRTVAQGHSLSILRQRLKEEMSN